MLKLKAATTLILFLGAALAMAQEIYQKEDKFSGDTHFFTQDRSPELEGGSFISGRYVYFSFHAFKKTAKVAEPYVVSVNTHTPSWVFISRGESLILKIDGNEILNLQGTGSLGSRDVWSSNHLVETATYSIPHAVLKKIGNAKSVEFRILGERQNITGTWKPDLIADAASFASKVPELLGLTTQPTNTAGEKLEPQRLGVQFVAVPQAIADLLKMSTATGGMIMTVTPGSIAEKHGLKQGDVVLQFGEQIISTTENLQAAVSSVAAGAKVPVKVWRSAIEATVEIQF